jgi:hypothetical protein
LICWPDAFCWRRDQQMVVHPAARPGMCFL